MSTEIATRNATSAVSVMTADGYKAAMGLAQTLVDSGFLPRAIQKPAQALAIILAGQEYNLPPMQSLRQIHIVEGKPTFSAELMLSLFKRRGGRTSWIESTDKRAVLKLHHPNGDEHVETFTMEDATRAGVTGKDNWRKYPKAMLRARCVSAGIRALGEADGVYTPEELGDGADPDDEPAAIVTDPGNADPAANQRRLAGAGPKESTAALPPLPAECASSGEAPAPSMDIRGDVDGWPADTAAGELEAQSTDLVRCWTWKQTGGSAKNHNQTGEWCDIGMHEKRTLAQNAKVHALKSELGITDAQWKERLVGLYSKESSADLSVEEATDLIDKLEARKKQHGTKADKDAKQARRAREAAQEMADAIREPGSEG